jgi:hypothetical protein
MAGLLGVASYLVLLAAVVLAFIHVVTSWPRGFAHQCSAVAIVLFVEIAALWAAS